jgi:alpha-1,6-mannosyltransferase
MSSEVLEPQDSISARWVPSHLVDGLGRAWRDSAAQLSVLALASWGIYVRMFVQPYNLYAWWMIPERTIGKITHYDPRAGVSYTLAFLALFLFYWLACRLASRRPRLLTWRAVIGGAAAFNLALLSLYPVDSADVFDNIMRGRITQAYGGNPFYQTPIEFERDPFYNYTAWVYYPSAYGPWWESIAAGATKVAGEGVIANVLAFKGVSILAYAATAALIGLTLRRTAPERALYGVTLFAWNPLVLYSTAGNAHNDALMLLFIVLGFYCLARGHFTLAALAETAGALIKFIPALLVPLVIVAGLGRLSGWRVRIRFVVLTLGACAALVVASYASYWRGGDVLGLERRTDLFTTSLSTWVELILASRLGTKFADVLVTRGALILLAAWIIRQAWLIWLRRDAEVPVRAALSVLLFYLLVAVPWFQAWYAIWPLALAALLPDSVRSRGSVLLSLAATLKMPLFDFVLTVRPGALPAATWLEPRLTSGTLGLPWMYFLFQSLKARLGVRR